MKKLIGCLIVATLLPVALVVGCSRTYDVPTIPSANITSTRTSTATNTPTHNLNATASMTPTSTATSTATNTATNTSTVGAIPNTATNTATATSTNTTTHTATNTATSTATNTATMTPTGSIAGPATVPLGAVATYVILTYNSVTNSGASTVCSGLVGENPGTSVTGYNGPAGTYMECSGVDITPDFSPNAGTAEGALTNAYNNAASRSPTVLANPELGGLTLAPGVYGSTPSLDVTGTLILDGTGYANGGVFIFQTAGILTTASASNVVLAGGAQAANIFWQVGNFVSLGANSSFEGNIMCATYIAFDTGAVLDGRALSESSYVSLLSNAISIQ